ncbi:uncharacterized protein LOC134540509 [Bacillus rossius redtenbacheri]|uniref:uncharacterized protein LOC134528212 n=2 Tax=Bacillus rossius redtenbacheri TaxID=93214 RepID=UPI002FDE8347
MNYIISLRLATLARKKKKLGLTQNPLPAGDGPATPTLPESPGGESSVPTVPDVTTMASSVAACTSRNTDDSTHTLSDDYQGNDDLPPLIVVYEPPLPQTDPGLSMLEGRMMVDVRHFMVQCRLLERHRCPISSSGTYFLESVNRYGLLTNFKFKCTHCNQEQQFKSEPVECLPVGRKRKCKIDTNLDINDKIVWGAISVGLGYGPLYELLSLIDMHPMSPGCFSYHENRIGEHWKAMLQKEMEDAALEEFSMAKDDGRICMVGNEEYAWTIGILDGGWSQRSYGHRYSAKSGCAIIIGFYTKKLLFLGVRNKYCTACIRSERMEKEPTPHLCFRNWTDSSTAMEADIIVEGFRFCEAKYKLQFKKFVGDGDSSVHAAIVANVSYGRDVEKIECANHVVKNLKKNLYAIAKGIHMRHLSQSKIKALCRCARGCISNCGGDAMLLQSTLLNVPNHVFGDHKLCNLDVCERAGKTANPCSYDALPRELIVGIKQAFDRVRAKSQALVMDLTTNQAEMYMSLVARMAGGKQINRSQQGSYSRRATAAGLSFQLRYKWHGQTMKAITGHSPGVTVKRLMAKRQKQQANCRRRLDMNPHVPRKSESFKPQGDKSYGPHATQPPASGLELEILTESVMRSIELTVQERNDLEVQTRDQGSSQLWMKERRKRVTASFFGRVCKMRENTSCKVTVEAIVYSRVLENAATIHGLANERIAVALYEEQTGHTVKQCGLFVDLQHCFLAASPDGLVDEDGLVEVKCPYSARELNPLDAAMQLKTFFCRVVDGELCLNRSHNYYYQVQGQLHITRRKWCDFVVWTTKGISIERIVRDDCFWLEKMESKLLRFFNNCLLPELADPCRPRGQPIREPEYIIQAQESRSKKRKISDV